MDRFTRRIGDWFRRRTKLVSTTITSAAQVGVAAGASWWLADSVVSWDSPIYAPIGAIVAIGTGENRMAGRPVRLLGGMVLAVAVAGVTVTWLGTGPWQILLITTLTTVVGRFFFDDPLARGYAAFHGAVIGALGSGGVIPEQIFEAAIGATVGLVTVHVVFPPRVDPTVLSTVERAVYASQRSLRAAAMALKSGYRQESERAVVAATEVDALLAPDDGRREFARQITRLAPARWRKRQRVEELIEADETLSGVLLDIASVARSVDHLMLYDPRSRPALARVVVDLERAVGWVRRQTEENGEAAEQVLSAVGRLRRDLYGLGDLTPREQMVGEKIEQLGDDLEAATKSLSR
ncbi:MAG TPA: hypothetical protein VHL52_05370 [Acidimicrobiia bacterium]|nr:hypothetical protein [Acidimicrobiia bacterium]